MLERTQRLLEELIEGTQPNYIQIDNALAEIKQTQHSSSKVTIVQDPVTNPQDQTIMILGRTLGALVDLIAEMRRKNALTLVTSEIASVVLDAKEHLAENHHEAQHLHKYDGISFKPQPMPEVPKLLPPPPPYFGE